MNAAPPSTVLGRAGHCGKEHAIAGLLTKRRLNPTGMFCCRIGKTAEKLEDAAVQMHRTATVIEATSKSMSSRDPLRPFMDKIYQQVQQRNDVT